MDMEVYEDQTGERLFPVNHYKDEKIKRFFSGGVNLYIDKRVDKLTIICHLIARRGLDRYQGYYIKCYDNYTNNSFSKFKKDGEKILRDLELQIKDPDIENKIFNNLDKFDLELKRETSNIIGAIKNNNYLDYSAGNINEISSFCNDILRNVNNIKIVISSEESKLGDINILRSNNIDEGLTPSDNTVEILNRYKKIELDEKKKLDAETGRNKIIEGLTILKSSGNEEELYKIYDKISEKIGKKSNDISIEEKKEKTQTPYFLVILMFIFGIVSGVVLGAIYSSDLQSYVLKFSDKENVQTTPASISTTPTPEMTTEPVMPATTNATPANITPKNTTSNMTPPNNTTSNMIPQNTTPANRSSK